MNPKTRGVMELLLCSALWSIAGIFMKLIPWSGFAIAGIRSLLAGIVAAGYMALRKTKFVFCAQSVFSALSLAVTMVLFSVANKTTTAANAIVLQFTSPIWVMLLPAFFKKKQLCREDTLAVALTFAGIALFFADGLGGGHFWGDILSLASGLTFACYYLSLGDCEENVRTSSLVMAHGLTFLIGLPFLLTTHPVISGRIVLYLLILGVFQSGIPYILLAHGSSYCPPLACSLLGALEPLLNPVWVAIFDGEVPGIKALIGGIIVIVTVAVWTVRKDMNEEKNQAE